MSLTRYGFQTGAAYLRMGLTRALYNIEKTFVFAVSTDRLIVPRILFALLTVIQTCLLHVRSGETVTPRSLKLSVSFKIDVPKV
jgi:hypothetical protein